MTQQTIYLGASPDDGTGDPLRTAFAKINANFSELYAAGGGVFIQAGAGAVTRTMQDKARERVSVEDYTDPVTATNTARRYSEVAFTEPAYTLAANVFAPGRLLSGSGTTFSGSNIIVGLTDSTANVGRWQAMYADAAGNATASSANEHMAFDSMVVPATGSLAAYQKNGRYISVRSYEPSDYTNPANIIYRDVVGLESMGHIMPGNMLGRIWGAHSIAHIYPGGDGLAIGHEVETWNYGTDQPAINTGTSKYGLHVVAVGGPVTAGIKASQRDGGLFHDFINAESSNITNNFLNLKDKFRVTNTGEVRWVLPPVAQPLLNGEITFELNTNTMIVFKAKGLDGVVRFAGLTLT